VTHKTLPLSADPRGPPIGPIRFAAAITASGGRKARGAERAWVDRRHLCYPWLRALPGDDPYRRCDPWRGGGGYAGAEVLIHDEIGTYGISARCFLAELGALPEGAAIDLRLNSPGGSVFDAVAIHNALSRHAGTVTVWIDGIAASAASYIAMAGDEIVMPETPS